MNRVVILGRGAAGKSTLAAHLGALTGIPVIELDQVFWTADLTPTPPAEWIAGQQALARADRWIMDGDLGPYDALAPRLSRADTVLLLDFALPRCAWRALRRSHERHDFWLWLATWRHRHRPALLTAIATHAPAAALHTLHTPSQVHRFVATVHTI